MIDYLKITIVPLAHRWMPGQDEDKDLITGWRRLYDDACKLLKELESKEWTQEEEEQDQEAEAYLVAAAARPDNSDIDEIKMNAAIAKMSPFFMNRALDKIKRERAQESAEALRAAKQAVEERTKARAKARSEQKRRYDNAVAKYRSALETLLRRAEKEDAVLSRALKAEKEMGESALAYASLLEATFAAKQKTGPPLNRKQRKAFDLLTKAMDKNRAIIEEYATSVSEAERHARIRAALGGGATGGSLDSSDSGHAWVSEFGDMASNVLQSVRDMASFDFGLQKPRGLKSLMCGSGAPVQEDEHGSVRDTGIMELPPGVLVISDKRVLAMTADVANGEKVAGAPIYEPDSVQLRIEEPTGDCCSCLAGCCVVNRIHKYKLTAVYGADDKPQYLELLKAANVVGPVSTVAKTTAVAEATVSSDACCGPVFSKTSCGARSCCISHNNWAVDMDEAPKLLVNRSMAFFVKRLPDCELVPEEMRGMWANVRVHFKSAVSTAQLQAVASLFDAKLPGSITAEADLPALPAPKPEPKPLPPLKALPPLKSISFARLSIKDGAVGSASSASAGATGGPINVAIHIAGGDDKGKAIVVDSKSKSEVSA